MIDFPYTVIRSSRRKTIGVFINPDNTVIVRAPNFLDERIIKQILRDKSKWIADKLAMNLQRNERQIQRHYAEGEEFLFLGTLRQLEVVSGKGGVTVTDNRLRVELPGDSKENERTRVVGHVHEWYRNQALHYLAERILIYRDRLKVYPKSMRVKKLKSRWGSCSNRGNLNFNWLIIMAPPPIIDYVVVHELCHLLQPNHSPRFWGLVESELPDYKERRKWLRMNAERMIM